MRLTILFFSGFLFLLDARLLGDSGDTSTGWQQRHILGTRVTLKF